MKFERLTPCKIRITLNKKDLQNENVSVEDLIKDKVDTQSLFTSIINKAEKKMGLNMRNIMFRIESSFNSVGNFIVTVTKTTNGRPSKFDPLTSNNSENSPYNSNTPASNFIGNSNNSSYSPNRLGRVPNKPILKVRSNEIFKFYNWDTLIDFFHSLKILKLPKIKTFTKNFSIYLYKNNYYLILNDIDKDYDKISLFSSHIFEFSAVHFYDTIFLNRLKESGELIIENNIWTKLNSII